MWELFQRSLAKIGIDAAKGRGRQRTGQGSGFPSPERALLCAPSPGDYLQQGGGSEQLARGRWYLSPARVLSICPFVASGGGGGEGGRTERGSRLPRLPVGGEALQLSGVRTLRGLGAGGCRLIPEQTHFSFHLSGLAQFPLILESERGGQEG